MNRRKAAIFLGIVVNVFIPKGIHAYTHLQNKTIYYWFDRCSRLKPTATYNEKFSEYFSHSVKTLFSFDIFQKHVGQFLDFSNSTNFND